MGRAVSTSERMKLAAMWGRIDVLLKERDLTWGDLATLIGVEASTLSTAKTGSTNIGILTMVKIAESLQVSLDEICLPNGKTTEYFDLMWAIPKVFPESVFQAKCCDMMHDMLMTAGIDPVAELMTPEELEADGNYTEDWPDDPDEGDCYLENEDGNIEDVVRLDRTKKEIAKVLRMAEVAKAVRKRKREFDARLKAGKKNSKEPVT